MDEQQIKNLLYTIYSAGFNHGSNEGSFPEHGTFEAFNRLLIDKSPMEDSVSYSIKEKVEKLLLLGNIKPITQNYTREQVLKLIRYGMEYAQENHMEYPYVYFDKWVEDNL